MVVRTVGSEEEGKGDLHPHWKFRKWSKSQWAAKGLEVKVKHLPEALKYGQTSGSSNAIKSREAHVELFHWTREGKFWWRIYLKKYFFVLIFFQSEESYDFPGQSVCMLGKKKSHINKSELFFFTTATLQSKTNRYLNKSLLFIFSLSLD